MDVATPHLRLQPVADGVFYQRLQQQRRHRCALQALGQIQCESQAWAHAHRHDLQVIGQAGKLIGQRVQCGACTAQRGAQVGDQVVQHGLGARRVGGDQHAQVGQGVEHHVGFELRLQQLEPRLSGIALGLGHVCLQVGCLAPAVKEEGDGDAGRHGDEQRGHHIVALQQPRRRAAVGIAQGRAQHKAHADAADDQGNAAPTHGPRNITRAAQPVSSQFDDQPAAQADPQRIHQLHVPGAVFGQCERQCDQAAQHGRDEAVARKRAKVEVGHGAWWAGAVAVRHCAFLQGWLAVQRCAFALQQLGIQAATGHGNPDGGAVDQ